MRTIKTQMPQAPFKIGLSGASSFTGVWIAEALKKSGHKVYAPLSRLRQDYRGLQLKRLIELENHASVRFGLPLSSRELLQWIKEEKPEVWVHHNHYMENFRSHSYDLELARRLCLDPLEDLVSVLKKSGCQAIAYSGTAIEPSEVDYKSTTPLPYAVSKQEVWDRLLELSSKSGIALAKIVIPNPVGPLENEDRLIPQMIVKSKEGIPLKANPNAEMKSISVFELADCYCEAIRSISSNKTLILRPLSIRHELEPWVKLVNEELLVKRLGLRPCAFDWTSKLNQKSAFHPNFEQFNDAFWDRYAQETKETAK